MAPVITVAIVDDDRMLVEGLRSWVRDAPDLRLVDATGTVAELLSGASDPDVVLLDLMLRDGSEPTENVRQLVTPDRQVLVVSVWSEPDLIVATQAAGARGYLTKDRGFAALAEAIREVAAGGVAYSPELAAAVLDDEDGRRRPRLSPQERAILTAYASGMTLETAARHVGVKPGTAKTYLSRIKAKYNEAGRPTYTKLDLAQRVREDWPRL
ncbi:response regulator transcription factor [Nocardia sp. NPDC051832]|uniref:response regulator transcription factor n=1 Tax=Nocardia sp. NPDC051832 TaxID=3155673 RepID=UPI00342AE49D